MKNWRINLILFLIFLFGAAAISRLVFLQILQGDLYNALAQGQQKIFAEITGDRGEIFFKNQIPLAVNEPGELCYICPKEIKEKEKMAALLSEVLDFNNSSTTKDLILEKLKKDNLYLVLKDKFTPQEIRNLKKLNLPGVYFKKEKFRTYPQKLLGAHLIGYLGKEGKGQYGIEGYWDDTLQGKKEFIVEEKKPTGFIFSLLEKKFDTRGSDLILTIDYNIQYKAEKLLKKAFDLWKIEEGTIIVIDPISGEILAMANFPSFDPNRYNEYAKKENFKIFQNSSIQKLFEPGSVFKPITFAAAIDQGKITPKTTYIDKGIVKIGGRTIYNYKHKVWGKQTMTEVLEKSINTGAVFVEQKLPHNVFLDYISRFGIFEPTEIDLQGEEFSQNEELKKGYEINFATASFGQGIEMTPIQLVRAFSAIANGGKLIRPHIVKKIRKSNNEITEIQPEIASNNVISSKSASQLTAMLVSVVEHGFAKKAQIPGYYVAGKTGTAQIPFSSLGIKKAGYSDETIHTFVGFAPAFEPRFLILVKLDKPQGVKTSSVSAVPIFQELAKYIIDYYKIPPDY